MLWVIPSARVGDGPGCVGQAWEECKGAGTVSYGHGVSPSYRETAGHGAKKTQRPFDGKHLGLSGPQAVDGGGG